MVIGFSSQLKNLVSML